MKNRQVKILSVMHPFPHTVGTNQTLDVALDMMREHGFRHLPVKDSNKLVGIITERDINFALRFDKKDPQELKVKDAYMGEPYTVSPETPVYQVAAKMAHEHLGCALIVEHDKLVGIFTTVDACRLLSEVLSEHIEQ